MKFKALYILLILLVSSCKDVIEVDLKDAEPRLVIEGQLYNKFRKSSVILSRSTKFFGNPKLDFVSGAKIIIRDEDGRKATLIEDSAGFYSSTFKGQPDKTYNIEVSVDDKMYTAKSYLPPPLKIDSLSVISLKEEYNFDSDEFGIFCHFKDSLGHRDFAKFNIYKNFMPSFAIYLYDDFYTDGVNFDFFFWSDFVKENDTIIVEMLTLNQDVYDYFLNLSDIAGGSSTGTATPYNPKSNLSNDALGYFGTFGYSVAAIIVHKDSTSMQEKSNHETEKILERFRQQRSNKTLIFNKLQDTPTNP